MCWCWRSWRASKPILPACSAPTRSACSAAALDWVSTASAVRSVALARISQRPCCEIERRLEDLAEKTKRPKSFYIKDMLEKYLDEYEEAYLALERISEKNAR